MTKPNDREVEAAYDLAERHMNEKHELLRVNRRYLDEIVKLQQQRDDLQRKLEGLIASNHELLAALRQVCDLTDRNEVEIPSNVLHLMSEVLQ